MDRRQIGTKLVLEALGLSAKRLSTFNERLTIQKAIYLAQAAGVSLGYHFRWYLRGPYSPDLTNDVFAVAAELGEGVDESEGWRLDERWYAVLQRLRGLIPAGDPQRRARELELLASAHFLVRRGQVSRADATETAGVLRRFGKDYSVEDAARSLGVLREHGLLPG
jgi:hypothetical protein